MTRLSIFEVFGLLTPGLLHMHWKMYKNIVDTSFQNCKGYIFQFKLLFVILQSILESFFNIILVLIFWSSWKRLSYRRWVLAFESPAAQKFHEHNLDVSDVVHLERLRRIRTFLIHHTTSSRKCMVAIIQRRCRRERNSKIRACSFLKVRACPI